MSAGFEVKSLAGDVLELQTNDELNFYKQAQAKYREEFSFTAASDLRALDRLIFNETMVFRWQTWLASGVTNEGPMDLITGDRLRRNIKDVSGLIADIQKDLGLTFSQRQKEQYESVGSYINKLKIAAKEFGIHRETQLSTALDLFNRVLSVAGTWLRSSETERRRLGFKDSDEILNWIDTEVRAIYDEVDKKFVAGQVRYVREELDS